ncbi:hypothetical protein, partial [Marinibactrum halimedae]
NGLATSESMMGLGFMMMGGRSMAEQIYDGAVDIYNEVTSNYAAGEFQQAGVAASGVAGMALTRRPVKKYEVGTFDDLTTRSVKGDKLDIHHAAQKHPAGQVIDGYDPKTAPSMAVPQREHRRIPTIKGTYSGNPRDLLSKDVRDLRNYTNAPNSNIKDLIRLNKEMFPDAFKKK